MMDWTDRHCRAFHRTLSARARLYTEMVTTGAVLHGPRERLLGFSDLEHPVAVQLGGSDPAELAQAARIAADFGYAEINLNVGCPSDRVQDGRFGACLMAEPTLVAECVAAMKSSVAIPVTVKCRIGIDEQDPHESLTALTTAVVNAGVDGLIVHARKAWLKGLSPKENRDIPPLDYPLVYRLKKLWPDLPISINGGIVEIGDIKQHLLHVDGVMLGRAAYQEPWRLLDVDAELFKSSAPGQTMKQALERFIPYVETQIAQGVRLHAMTRHLVGAFHGVPGARAFRRFLAENATQPAADAATLRQAIALVSDRFEVAA
jgi:tRNA-dihydrouridine synthase A